MFDKIGQAAEKVAVNVSRRAFLGRFGRGAALFAGAVTGVLMTATKARAGNTMCCFTNLYSSPCYVYKAVKGTCPCGGVLSPCNSMSCRHMKC
jgi:hypothetical protein